MKHVSFLNRSDIANCKGQMIIGEAKNLKTYGLPPNLQTKLTFEGLDRRRAVQMFRFARDLMHSVNSGRTVHRP